jgi:outer membrane biogenesis lipoprotein LolB
MNRLFRLLPLASLVLTACSIHARKGLAKARIRRSGVSTSRMSAINQFQTRGALLISPMSKKSMPASSGSKPAGPLSPAAD